MPNDYYNELDLNGDRRPIIDDNAMRKVDPTGSGALSINRVTNSIVGSNSVAIGDGCIASNVGSYAEGSGTVSSGQYSHAEGQDNTASGHASHAEGQDNTASRLTAHAEGNGTTASGENSHAEGQDTTASGLDSHAEGYSTTASYDSAHAEGVESIASAYCSHAEGYFTIAAGINQHVSGQWNIEDQNNEYAEIVGNGTNQSRSNARTLDWQGNETIAGDFYFNGGSDSLTTQLSNKADTSTIPTDADQISYDNQTSGLTATDVQEAIDEVNTIASGVSNKMDKVNPTGSGALSINRAANSTVGSNSVAVGDACEASGAASFAEGNSTEASGDYSHAEGGGTQAAGNYSHAEGADSSVFTGALCAHVEGYINTTSGSYSHVEGYSNHCSTDCQHVFGKNSIEDVNHDYVEVVGNGSSGTTRSNARTLDWSGNETIAGDLYFNGGASPLSAQLAAKADPPSAITQDQTGSVELTHNAWKQIKTFTLSKGLYIIHAGVVFQGVNSTGIRAFTITTTSAASGGGINTTRAPGSSNDTNIHMTIPVEVTAASQTFYINAYQNAGTGVTLTAQPRFEYVKLR